MRGRKLSSICWFFPQVATSAGADGDAAGLPQLHLGLCYAGPERWWIPARIYTGGNLEQRGARS